MILHTSAASPTHGRPHTLPALSAALSSPPPSLLFPLTCDWLLRKWGSFPATSMLFVSLMEAGPCCWSFNLCSAPPPPDPSPLTLQGCVGGSHLERQSDCHAGQAWPAPLFYSSTDGRWVSRLPLYSDCSLFVLANTTWHCVQSTGRQRGVSHLLL